MIPRNITYLNGMKQHIFSHFNTNILLSDVVDLVLLIFPLFVGWVVILAMLGTLIFGRDSLILSDQVIRLLRIHVLDLNVFIFLLDLMIIQFFSKMILLIY